MAAAAGLSAGARGEVRPPRRAWHDPQPLHPRPERLWDRAAVRIATRGVGRRHRRRTELCRAAADRGYGRARGPDRGGARVRSARDRGILREQRMSDRRSINGPRARHQNPTPNASRIGNVVMSSVISGISPETRDLPPDLPGQLVNLFGHIRGDIEAAGGCVDDIIKITFWMRDPTAGRAAIN